MNITKIYLCSCFSEILKLNLNAKSNIGFKEFHIVMQCTQWHKIEAQANFNTSKITGIEFGIVLCEIPYLKRVDSLRLAANMC